jgi:hypothetical protein
MGILVRAVVTGFGLSLGAAIYKRVEKRLGLTPEDPLPGAAKAGASTGSHIPGMPEDPSALA